MTSSNPRRALQLTLVIGLAVFAGGLAAAFTSLPEWRQDTLPDPQFFEEKLQVFLSRAGLATPVCTHRFQLSSGNEMLQATYRRLGRAAAPRLVEEQRAVAVGITLLTRWESSPWGHSKIVFSGRGEPLVFESNAAEWSGYLPGNWPQERPGHGQGLAEALTETDAPGLGEATRIMGPGGPMDIYSVPPDETVTVLVAPNWVTVGMREIGTISQTRSDLESTNFAEIVLLGFPLVARFLLALLVCIVLAFMRRLGMVNAVIVAAGVFVLGLLATFPVATGTLFFSTFLCAVLVKTVFVFVLWSGAESWIRSTIPGFSTSLDALRSGKLGPRSGRSLLGGWALGAAQAGLGLLLMTLAVRFPGVYPGDTSVPLPVFSVFQSPLGAGVVSAGFVLLSLALCRRLLAVRWVGPAAAALAGIFNLPQVDVEPWPFALLVSVILNAVLVFTFQRYGLTGLLSAALISEALPSAVFSALQLAWMPWTFASTALFSLAVPVVGWIGLSRPRDPELALMGAPAFIRRLEDERRMRYEMDLLARMQKGLLPAATPEVDGYEMAATSILANEAGGDLYDFVRDAEGGLWVAAGDVAGHGLSCTIEHAMTKAALASLIQAGCRPSRILHDVDRVLRTARSVRSFTSLSLLRLDPATGDVVFSNAGHPYPILLDGQDLSEISLPSLPLGQGPQRQYLDQKLVLRAGSVLVLLSDGLFESTDAAGRAYGYPRTRRILTENVDLPALEIRDALIADWRRHVGSGSPADDTTLVVLKRSG